MNRQNWAEALALANRMGIAPHAFWALSLMEWRALTKPAQTQSLSRKTLNSLCAKYPDKHND